MRTVKQGTFMTISKSYPAAPHFLGPVFMATARFCAVALLALLWVAQPASAQMPDLRGTTTPLPVTPGGDAVVVFPDLTVNDEDSDPVVVRIRIENPDDLNAADTLAFQGTPDTSGFQVQFFSGAEILGTGNDTLFGALAGLSGAVAEKWHGVLRNITFAAPAGSGGRELRLFAEVRYDTTNTSSDTLTRTLNIAAAPPTNSPATGNPTISGTPRVGQTLTAETGAIADADGLANVTFTYQWLEDGVAISGATAQTLVPTSAHVGADIEVQVSFTDDDGNNERRTSDLVSIAAAAAANSPPTGLPTVRGLFAQGRELTADTVNLADADGLPAASTFRYQWHTNDGTGSEPGTNTPIGGATSRTYTLTEDEVGLRIGVTVSYTDLGTPPTDESVTNTFIPLVTGPAAPLVADAGADQVVDEGEIVTLDGSGSSSPAPGPLSYLWGQDDNSGHDILLPNPLTAQQTFPAPSGLTEDAELVFLLGVSDTIGGFASDQVRVRVRAAASGSNNPPTGRLTIDGDPRSGQTLTADTSAIGDADGLPDAGTFTYQWFADDGTTNAAIGGATGSTYLLTDAQIDARISLVLRYTDNLGVAERVTSLAVGPVVPVNSAPVAVIAPIDPALLLTEGNLTGLDGGIDITLDGSGSSDPDGDNLTYLWSLSSATTGTPGGTLDNDGLSTPVLTLFERLSIADTLTISLTVTDPDGEENTATAEYTLLPEAPIPNRAPDALVGTGTATASLTAFSGETVTLDGSSSSDPDLGQTATLTYRWRHISNSFFGEIPLDGAGTPTASFTAPPSTSDTNINTNNEFELTVTDTAGASDTARVLVNIRPNSPPTGAVRITGIPLLGVTLTANTDTLGDPDGLPAASTFGYQWQRNGVGISGATERSYLLTADDAGQLITVTVSYEDTATPAGGKNESLRSDPVGPVIGAPVVIAGTPTQGEVLTADTSAIDGNPQPGAAFAYQWFANDGATNAEIAGATNRNYRLSQAEVGRRITLRVNYIDTDGTETGPLTSAPTAAVADANVGPSGVVRIDGRPTQGETLTADTTDIADDDGPASLTFTYQWNTRSGSTDTAISGETSATYLLSADDVGDQITVSVRYTDAEGTAEGPLTSAPTAAVAGFNLSGATTPLAVLPGDDAVAIFPDLRIDRGRPDTFRLRVESTADLNPGDMVALAPTAERSGYTIVFVPIANIAGPLNTIVGVSTPNNDDEAPERWHNLLRHFTFQAPAGSGGREVRFIAELTIPDLVNGTDDIVETLTRTLNISANNAPTSSGLTATLDEDDRHTFAADEFDFEDADSGNTLQQVRIDTLPDNTNGSLALNGAAVTAEQVIAVADIPTLVYTPAANVNGEATFTFSVSDGTDFSAAPATATLTVDAVNDPPTGTVTIAGTPVRGENLAANTFDIEDVEGQNVLPFTYQWNRGDGTTSEAISGATSVIYTLTADDVGEQITVSVRYTDAEGTDEGPLTSAPTAAILDEFHTISVTGESGTVDEGDDAFFTVTLSASPVDTIRIAYSTSIEDDDSAQENDFTPTSGVLSFASNNNLTAGITVPITADSEVEGNETFTLTLTVADGFTLPPTFILNPSATSARATIAGSAGSNTPPTTSGLAVSTNEDIAHTFAAGQFNFADTDSGDNLTAVRIDTLPAGANGSLALNGTAVIAGQEIAATGIPNLVYTPATNVNGDATFTFSVSDGTAFSTPPATATVTVTAVNDAPTTSNLTATIAEDNTHTFAAADFTFNDVDSGDTLQQVRIDTLPDSTDGSLALGTGTSATPVNPTQVIAVADIPTLVYTPVTNVNGAATFTFSVSDGTDFSATPATATVTVTAVNDPPTISGLPDKTVVQGEDYSFTPRGDDADDDTLEYAITNMPSWASFDETTGALTGTPASTDVANYENIVISVTDNIITTPVALSPFAIAVTATATTNMPPIANAGPNQRVSKGTEVTLDGTGSDDPDGDNSALIYLWERVSGPTEVTLSSAAVSQPTFTIPTVIPTNPASYTFRLTVNDGQESSAPATVRIFIRPLFQATIANQTFSAGNAITPITLPEARGGPDSLPSANTYTLTPVPLPAGLAFNATSRILSGTPTQAGTFDLTYTATNEFNDTDSLGFSITVTSAANNPPTTSGLTVSTNEDIAHTFAAAQFNFADTDSGDSLTAVRIDTLPAGANGSLALGTGTSATPVNIAQVIPVADIPTLVYTPATNVNGDATFTFSVSDGTDFSATPATATVTVTPVNDEPSGLPTISGTPRVGETLTANTGGISDIDGLTNTTFTYQWLEGGGTISGATAQTLVLTPAQLGADIEVRVSFTDDAGNDERLTSQAVSVLAAISETVSISGGGNVAEGADATFTVTLSGSPGAAVVVDYAVASGTATAGDDFGDPSGSGTLTFAANTTDLTQTFTVPVLTDSIVEGSETFTATLSANASTPLPTGFSLGTATATATIAAAGSATVSISGGGNVNEGDDATFTVILSGSPGAAVMVDYATVAGTATAGDFTARNGTLTFAAGVTGTALSQTFTVPVENDNLLEGDESFTVTLSANTVSPLPAGFALVTATATVIIAENDVEERLADLNNTVLPEVARAFTDQTVGAITKRIGQARDGTTRSVAIAGQSTLAGAASVHGQAIADGTLSLKDVLGNSDFVLPLDSVDGGMDDGIMSSLTLWGGGGYRNFEGSDGDVSFDGDLFSAHLGLDARPRDDLLIGFAASWGQSDLDYKGVSDLSGDHKLNITSVHPYASWEALAGQLDLWVTAGYGWGELEIANDGMKRVSSDVKMRTVGGGSDYQLPQIGATKFKLKSSALLTELEVEGGDDIEALDVESSLLRMVLEGSHKLMLSDRAYVEPSLEAGVRYDGGDGETGFGAELGAGFRYIDPIAGLTLEGRARTLVGRDNYEEWGVSGLILLEQGRNGRGLSFSLSPGYGITDSSSTQELWREGLRNEISDDRDYGARLDTRLGYGLTAPGGQGLLTPYSEMTFGGSSRSYRLGMRWELDSLFNLNLTGERSESDNNATDHAIMLKGDIQF